MCNRNYQYTGDDFTALSLHPRDRAELHRLIDDDAGTAWHDADGDLVAYALTDAAAPKSSADVELPSLDYLGDLIGTVEEELTDAIDGGATDGAYILNSLKLVRRELEEVAHELTQVKEELTK